MGQHNLETLAARVVPKLKQELARPDGGLPGERERIAAFDTCDVLLRAYVAELKTELSLLNQQARQLDAIADAELPSAIRLEIDRNRREEED